MSYLSFIEKETIYRLFDIRHGYVFKHWSECSIYNKIKTKEIILESCGINIFKDSKYSKLSQQRCIEKIFDECSPQSIAKLLELLSGYFCFQMGTLLWSNDDECDYSEVQKIIDRLKSMPTMDLPKSDGSTTLHILMEDIETNIKNGKPELVIDRLHTFTTEYLRVLCHSHEICTIDNKGRELPLHSLVGMLKNWYITNEYFDSEFTTVAIQNTINIFDKYNEIRNDNSAAHPNQLLSKAEAEYAVKIISNTLDFIDKCEKSKTKEATPPWEINFLEFDNDENLPF